MRHRVWDLFGGTPPPRSTPSCFRTACPTVCFETGLLTYKFHWAYAGPIIFFYLNLRNTVFGRLWLLTDLFGSDLFEMINESRFQEKELQALSAMRREEQRSMGLRCSEFRLSLASKICGSQSPKCCDLLSFAVSLFPFSQGTRRAQAAGWRVNAYGERRGLESRASSQDSKFRTTSSFSFANAAIERWQKQSTTARPLVTSPCQVLW